MLNQLEGVGLLAQALVDILVKKPPDYVAAYNDVMLGLSKFGLHTAIVKAMEVETKKNGAPQVEKAEK